MKLGSWSRWAVVLLVASGVIAPQAVAAPGGKGGGSGGKRTKCTEEICDGKDNDCDGLVDGDAVCAITYYCDGDRDGYPAASPSGTCSIFGCLPPGCSTARGTDCNDADARVNPGAIDNCDANGVDDDCDGTADECAPCANGVRDGSETDVDCGGECVGCEIGEGCAGDADCLSRYCSQGACASPPSSLDPSCVPLKYDNSTSNHINLVLVPSAFQGDMQLFRQKAEWIASIFSGYEPFGSSIATYNVFYVPQEAGDYCHFNCNGIARLLCCNTSTARALSSICTSGPRQTIVVHNSTTYGGAGYTYSDVATTSVHSSAPRIAVHELGHSLFDLGDEYDYGSATPSFPNCDYAGCSRWSDMLGYNGVSCTGGSCAGGSYFTSETTVMRSLSYAFEEVNLRLSCCTYARETGQYPPYCDQFRRFTAANNLNEFCFGTAAGGASSVPLDYLENPEELTFVRGADGFTWTLESRTRRRQGFYPAVKTRGQGRGPLRVEIAFQNGEKRLLRFEDFEPVEYPAGLDTLGGFTTQVRETLTVVIDRKRRGAIERIQVADEQR